MPIFEFHCQACDQNFEKLVFGSDPEVECPHCGQKTGGEADERLQRQGGHEDDGVLQPQGRGLRQLLFRVLQHLPLGEELSSRDQNRHPGQRPGPDPVPLGPGADRGAPSRVPGGAGHHQDQRRQDSGRASGPDRGQGPVHQGDRGGPAFRPRLTWRCTASRTCRRWCRRA